MLQFPCSPAAGSANRIDTPSCSFRFSGKIVKWKVFPLLESVGNKLGSGSLPRFLRDIGYLPLPILLLPEGRKRYSTVWSGLCRAVTKGILILGAYGSRKDLRNVFSMPISLVNPHFSCLWRLEMWLGGTPQPIWMSHRTLFSNTEFLSKSQCFIFHARPQLEVPIELTPPAVVFGSPGKL